MEQQARNVRYQEIIDMVEPLIQEIAELVAEEESGSKRAEMVIRSAISGRRMVAFLDQAREPDLLYAGE